MIRKIIAIYRLYIKVKEEMRMNGIKSGWQTTEFWVCIATIAGTLYSGFGEYIKPALMIQVVAGITGMYTIARAIVKLTPSTKDDEAIEKIVQAFLSKSKPK